MLHSTKHIKQQGIYNNIVFVLILFEFISYYYL